MHNGGSTNALFNQSEHFYALATWIYIICDNARHYRSTAAQNYLQDSGARIVFLPHRVPFRISSNGCGTRK
jgi:hypothetical protein